MRLSGMRSILGALLTAGAAIALGTLLALGLIEALRLVGVAPAGMTTILISLVMTQGVAFCAVALFRLRHLSWPDRIDWLGLRRPNSGDALAALDATGFAVMGSILSGWVVKGLGIGVGEHGLTVMGHEQPTLLVVMLPLSLLLVGPGEELLFRGIIQQSLRENLSPVLALSVASLTFAGVHALAVAGSPSQILAYVLMLVLPTSCSAGFKNAAGTFGPRPARTGSTTSCSSSLRTCWRYGGRFRWAVGDEL